MLNEIKDAIWNYKTHHAHKPKAIMLSINQFNELVDQLSETSDIGIDKFDNPKDLKIDDVLILKKMDCLDLSSVNYEQEKSPD
jgi:hypothetical protein